MVAEGNLGIISMWKTFKLYSTSSMLNRMRETIKYQAQTANSLGEVQLSKSNPGYKRTEDRNLQDL